MRWSILFAAIGVLAGADGARAQPLADEPLILRCSMHRERIFKLDVNGSSILNWNEDGRYWFRLVDQVLIVSRTEFRIEKRHSTGLMESLLVISRRTGEAEEVLYLDRDRLSGRHGGCERTVEPGGMKF